MRRLLAVTAALLLGVPVATATAAAPRGPGDYSEMTYEHVRVPMRDGIELSVDIWRPVTPARVKVPVILTLTPYHSLYAAVYGGPPLTQEPPTLPGSEFIRRGYAFAVADVRGTWGSGGCWDYGGIQERHDGYDLVEWLGKRSWTNGKVGMIGASYDGTTANAAAVEAPPHLATIVPISSISRWWGYAYQQGARATLSGEDDDTDPPGVTPFDFMFAYGFLPPADPAAVAAAQQIAQRWTPCDRVAQTLRGYTDPTYDAFWQDRDYLRLAHRVKVPVLIGHGLLDFNVKSWEGTAWFQALRTPKRMVLGQWPHALPRIGDWGELLDLWFARYLYGVRNGVERGPAVLVEANDREIYARPRWGAGKVRRLPLGPGVGELVDTGTVTESEMLRGPQTPRFLTVNLPATEGLHVSGRPVLRLTVSSSAPNTQLTAVLVDVAEADGARTVVSRAFLDTRFRGSWQTPSDHAPGTAYTAPLEFIDKEWVVAPGHYLQVLIASSSTTWVLPDEQRSVNTVDLGRSRIDLPLA